MKFDPKKETEVYDKDGKLVDTIHPNQSGGMQEYSDNSSELSDISNIFLNDSDEEEIL